MRNQYRKFKYQCKPPKPYRVMTADGDYFFETEEEARSFADARCGFVIIPKGTTSRSNQG